MVKSRLSLSLKFSLSCQQSTLALPSCPLLCLREFNFEKDLSRATKAKKKTCNGTLFKSFDKKWSLRIIARRIHKREEEEEEEDDEKE